jgi:parallel beta-helix repeat protein
MTLLRLLPAIPLVAVLSMIGACGARVPGRHVSPSGRDAGDCLGAPCATIGYAVRQAGPGDTISVDSGTYHEAVMITRRVALIGHHATIDAAGQASPPNGVMISGDSAAGTRVEGFTIRNSGLEGIYALRTSHVTIENDVLEHNDAYGTGNPLCTKHQSDCGEAIHLQTVSDAVVRGNTVRNNLGGILLTDETGPTHDNEIADNLVTDNAKDCGITLASHWVDTTAAATAAVAGIYHNTVRSNTVSGSGGAGIGIFAAGPGGAAWGNVVEGNTTTGNKFAGLMIHGHAPHENVDGNVFRNNTVAGNGTDVLNPADHAPAGISLFSAVVPIRNTVISGNRISNEHFGIIALHVDSLTTLVSNTFDHSVAVPSSMH